MELKESKHTPGNRQNYKDNHQFPKILQNMHHNKEYLKNILNVKAVVRYG